MKTCRVIIAKAVQEDLDQAVSYVIEKYGNYQAASAIADDYDETIQRLERYAMVLPLSHHPSFAKREWKCCHLKSHAYYLLFRVENETAYVIRMFHDLQDPDL